MVCSGRKRPSSGASRPIAAILAWRSGLGFGTGQDRADVIGPPAPEVHGPLQCGGQRVVPVRSMQGEQLREFVTRPAK